MTPDEIRAEAIERIARAQFQIRTRSYLPREAWVWERQPPVDQKIYRRWAAPLVDALGDLLAAGSATDVGEPAGLHHTLETTFATDNFGFPSDPMQGDTWTAPDGSEWTFDLTGTRRWEISRHAPHTPRTQQLEGWASGTLSFPPTWEEREAGYVRAMSVELLARRQQAADCALCSDPQPHDGFLAASMRASRAVSDAYLLGLRHRPTEGGSSQ